MRSAALFVLLIASVCAHAQDEDAGEVAPTDEKVSPAEPAPTDVDEILSSPLDESDYRKQSACITMRAVDDVEVLDDTLVLFRGRRGEFWLNQLASQCYGLDQDVSLRFRLRGGRYCRLDAFRGVSRGGSITITSECRLGYFETMDELQVDALRTAVDERRAVEDMASKTRRQERRRRKSDD